MNIIKKVGVSLALFLGMATFSGYASGGDKPVLISNDDCLQAMDLKVDGSFDHDWLGESEIRGVIVNNSLTNEYEDALLNVRFYDDDHVLLGSETLKIDKDLDRGETENFKLEMETPRGTESADWSVVCVDQE